MPLSLTIGGGIGLMSLSVVIADMVMLYCTKEKKVYQRIKSKKMQGQVIKILEKDDAFDEKEEKTEMIENQDSINRQKGLKIGLNSLKPIYPSF